MHEKEHGILKLLSTPVVTGLPARAAAAKDRVVIAGAGIMGASIGNHLAKRGAQVTILEKQRPGNGATQKSFAWINSTFSKQPRSYYDLIKRLYYDKWLDSDSILTYIVIPM